MEPRREGGTPVRHVRQTDSRSQEGTLKAHPEINFGGIGGTAESLLVSPPFAQHPAISAASTLLRETARMSKWPTTQTQTMKAPRLSGCFPSRRQPTLPLAAVCICCGRHGRSALVRRG